MLKKYLTSPLLSAFNYLLYTAPMVLILTLGSFYFIDKPLAKFMLAVLAHPSRTQLSAHLAILLTQTIYTLFIPLFIFYFVRRLLNKQDRLTECLGIMSVSVAFTFFIKSALQFFFGRYVPRYGGHSYLLFVHNPKLYGFAWFQAGSFPSGHMAMLASFLTPICWFYRKHLIFVVTIVALLTMAFLLLLLNYHFLSDIIAGTYLGCTIALALVWLHEHAKRSATLSIP